MKNRYIITTVLLISCLLSSCGLKFRTPSQVPPALRVVYLQSSSPYNPFVVQLKRQLAALKVQFVKTPAQATSILHIDEVNFSHNQPNLTDINEAVTLTYRFSAIASVSDKHGKTILGPQKFSSVYNQVLNSTQIYTTNTAALTQQTLQNEVSSKLYSWLTSEYATKTLSEKIHDHAN